MRKMLIVGNWKMNGCRVDILNFFENIPPDFSTANCEAVLCLPYVYLDYANSLFKNSPIKLGAQNCHAREQGAHTGEVSASMLKDVGVEFVIIGHSERRQEFAEDSAVINKKLKAVLKNHMKPILCVGEQEYEYSRGMGKNVVEIQLKPSKTYSIFGFAAGIIFMITGLVIMFKQHNETGSYNLEFWGIWLSVCAVITVMNYLNAFTKKGIPVQEAIIENTNNYQTSSAEDIEVKLKQLNSLLQQGLITQEEFDKKRAELLEKL